MRLQQWSTRLSRKDRAGATRLTGARPAEVTTHLYNGLIELYSPLDVSRRELRTVTIAAGEFEADVHCYLNITSFLDNPSYEALSYAWGDQRPSRKLFINGKRYEISQNLESAFRHLRYKDQPRTLWIDALCINQNDIEERNSQVKHMGSVYHFASQVLAWLGAEYDNSDLAFEFLNTMPSDPKLHWDPKVYPELYTVYTYKHVYALNDLMERSWWHRVWTVQESVLCPNLLFICGDQQITANQAFAVAGNYFKHMYTCCQDIWSEVYKATSGQPGLGDVCSAWVKLAEMRVSRADHSFGQILSKFKSRHCSEPHDKIYGFLGFANKGDALAISPDYTRPVAEVFEEVALRLIEGSKELGILSLHHPKLPGDSLSPVQNLPSWVPNWALDTERVLLHDLDDRFSCLPKYNATSNSQAHAKHLSPSQLSVRGRVLAHVDKLSKDEHLLDAPSLSAYFKEWQDMIGLTTNPIQLYANSTSTTISDAYWQTLCCSLILGREQPQNQVLHRTSDDSPYKPCFDAWWKWCETHDWESPKVMLAGSEYSRAEINAMGGLILTSTVMRRLCKTDGVGWIGLVPMNAKAGDLVVLAEGGRVPYILRPVEGGKRGEYGLIGDAYVHGVMDGEEWGETGLEDLVLL